MIPEIKTPEIKTLLQNAARAAGLKVWSHPASLIAEGHKFYVMTKSGQVEWNPATNSGDSRDLQVKLKISLEPFSVGWVAWCKDKMPDGRYDADPNMAVLLVASAIGAAMKEGE